MSDRFILFPIKHHAIWKLYKNCLAKFWTAEEIDLAEDVKQWRHRLNDGQRKFIKNVLAFFAAADGIVAENLAVRFYGDIDIPEFRAFLGFQIGMEGIHAETYSRLIEAFIQDTTERNAVFHAIDTVPSIRAKGEWAKRWLLSDEPLGVRLVAMMAVEGIFFCGSFCAIFWLKKQGLMPGLTFSNELIFWDESQHCRAPMLYFQSNPSARPSNDRIKQIFAEATAIEIEFMRDTLNVALIGMNANLMARYIRFTTNWWLGELGAEPLYHQTTSTNPFEWMDLVSLTGKTNFFERRVGEYSRASVSATNSNTKTFTLDAEF